MYATYADYRNRVCYRILLSVSVTDAIQLFVHGYGGLVLLTGTAFDPLLEKVGRVFGAFPPFSLVSVEVRIRTLQILGGLLNANSVVLFVHQALLAINRFLVVKNVGNNSLAAEDRLFFVRFETYQRRCVGSVLKLCVLHTERRKRSRGNEIRN